MDSVDVITLKQFYASAMGRLLGNNVVKSIARLWPDEKSSDDVLTVGYSFPYLPFLMKHQKDVVPVMPAKHGAMVWPSGDDNIVVLSDEWELPFAKHSFNRVVVVHVLEHTRHPSKTLTELWNILVPGGRMILITPNRRSLWSQASSSPLGWGQPFSVGQLKKLAEKVGFTVLSSETTHFSLPLNYRIFHKIAPAFDLLGKMFLPMFGGVLVMEVEKQIYASVPDAEALTLDKVMSHSTQPIVSPKGNAKTH